MAVVIQSTLVATPIHTSYFLDQAKLAVMSTVASGFLEI